jgi:hypothetical protein
VSLSKSKLSCGAFVRAVRTWIAQVKQTAQIKKRELQGLERKKEK